MLSRLLLTDGWLVQTWLEENNTRLQQQVSHLTLELKSAGTGGGVSQEQVDQAQTILLLREQLEQAHKAEQELVKTLDAARIKSEEGLLAQIAKRDSEIARLNALLVSGDNSAEIEKLRRELAAEKVRAEHQTAYSWLFLNTRCCVALPTASCSTHSHIQPARSHIS